MNEQNKKLEELLDEYYGLVEEEKTTADKINLTGQYDYRFNQLKFMRENLHSRIIDMGGEV